MIEILFLGTSSMKPTKERNHSGILLKYGKENILLDCGEGTQRQMRIAGVKPARITKLLISHWHGDHVFGIPGLLTTMAADEYVGVLEIYGPKGTKLFMKNMFSWFSNKERINVVVKEVTAKSVFENEEFKIEAYPLKHSATCVGYSFIEKDKRKVDIKKATKLGLEGPILGELQKGKTVKFKNKKIVPDQISSVVKGKKVSYIADTLPCPGADNLANDADLLISEGTHLEDIKEKTKKYMHLTAKQAAEIAKKGKVSKLIITHISQRYKEDEDLLKEAKKTFKNSIIARDFMEIKV